MIVKLCLDEEMSEWLMKISSSECRSNAQQVLYWLKRIKAEHSENELEQHVPCKTNRDILEDKIRSDGGEKDIIQSNEE